MTEVVCPSRSELFAFSVGKLSEEASVEIVQHLESCPGCQSNIQELDDSDEPLAACLRHHAQPNEYERELECQQLVAMIETIGLNPSNSGGRGVADKLVLQRVGVYQILAKLGEGGMGTVYKALHTELEKVVALKVLPTERMQDEQAVSRFKREMKAVGKIDHPNIVRATDAGEVDGTHFLVMEYVEGIELSKLVQQVRPVPIADACELARQAAVGLQHAHEHGLVHRDIKPSNLILSKTGQTKVLDLGLARLHGQNALQENLISTHQMMGTVDYMAPEQFENSHGVDIRADIYGLGCTLYKLLTGHAPYSGPGYISVFQKMKAHIEAPLPSIADKRSDIPAELVAVLEQMLAKAPDDRFGTPAEVAAALESLAAEHDLQALARTALGKTETKPGDGEPRSTSDVSGKLTATFVPQQASFDASPEASTHRPKRGRLLAAALTAAVALLAGVVIYINTGRGQLEITVNVPDVQVTVDGKEPTNIEITSPRDKILIRIRDLPAGRHVMEVTKDGFTTQTASFYVFRNGKKELEAILTPLVAKSKTVPPKALNSQPSTLNLWTPGPKHNVLPGLIARPAKLPGINRWQVVTAGHRDRYLWSVAWSPDGRYIAVAGTIGQIRLYDATAPARLRLVRVLLGHTDNVWSLAWSPDGQQLASGSNDKTVRLWDADGTPGPLLKGHPTRVQSVTWSPDGKRLASVGGAVRLWGADGTPGPVHRNDFEVSSVAWCPDGNQLAIAGGPHGDGRMRLWNADDTPGPVLKGHAGKVTSVTWSPDGKWLASGSVDKTVRL